MPLHAADSTTTTPESLCDASEQYLIFYSSIVGLQMWCPDCRNVEDLVKRTFEGDDAPSALIVYTGDFPTWKSPSNVFRGRPWVIQSVPTIVKIQNGKEVERLVDSEITPGLARFVSF
ncbi:hypothetical protein D9757_004724 [Collybiopsis confluens]|uniref:Thioredoxin domain-containing protein n=1 Tax=Collybiopsis confluens TaxID=2823264 RepID=A0A8H5MBP0_9AGAR|nr:hypothetical protein D9757_004724 [Collybiopsis confluens]